MSKSRELLTQQLPMALLEIEREARQSAAQACIEIAKRKFEEGHTGGVLIGEIEEAIKQSYELT